MSIILELSPAVTRFLVELVKTGSFASESEYVGALIEQAWLDREVALGKEQAERGEFVDTNVEKIIQTGRSQLADQR
jgi:Arc/MetJ-type ribon-helix-helix transcriptional regulator